MELTARPTPVEVVAEIAVVTSLALWLGDNLGAPTAPSVC